MGEKMSKKIKMLVIVTLLAMSATAFGSLLLEENFDYPAGDSLLDHGWNLTGTNYVPAVYVYSPGLTYTGYASSGIGNAAKVDTGGQDVHHKFDSLTTGTAYYAFIASIQKATTTGDYFAHYGPKTIGSAFVGRVWARNNGSDNIQFGLGKGSADTTFTGYTYALNTTYLFVVKYEIVSGTVNDIVSLFIFTSGAPTNEPGTATIGPLSPSSTDPANIGAVALRQGSPDKGTRVIIDGVRVGTSWADVLPGTGTNPTKLVIISVNNGVNPTVNRPFSVVVQSQDDLGNLAPVVNNTGVQLSLASGTGILGGTLTGMIPATQNTITITGATYNLVQNNVSVKAETTYGDDLAPGTSALFNVLDSASHLAFVGVPLAAQPGIVMGSFTVQARRPDFSVDQSYTDSIFISKASGPGSVSGTLRKKALNGVATFDNVIFSVSGTYTLDASASGLTSATSSSINVLTIEIPLIENFEYTPATSLVYNGWSAHSTPGFVPILVTSPGLSYTGYLSSGIGNAATVTGGSGSREDVHRIFTSQTSGSVYAAFIIKATSASTSGDYLVHLGPQAIGTTFRGRLYFKKTSVGDSLAFGLGKFNETPVYTNNIYSLDTTYIIVIKYSFIEGADNDWVYLWVNPSLTGSEPTPDLSQTYTSDLTNCGSIGLRQGSVAYSAIVDGIRVGTSWGIISGNYPPTITNVTKDPEMPLANDIVRISAKIYDDSTAVGAIIDSFFYAQNNTSSWTAVAKDSFHASDSLFFYTIPDTPIEGETIFYKVVAKDDDGNGTNSSNYRYILPFELTVDEIQGGVPSSPYVGKYVYSKGIVNGSFPPDGFFGPGSDPFEGAVWFYRLSSESLPKANLGDSVAIFGVVQEYKTLTEINANANKGGKIKILNSGNPIPDPINLPIMGITEDYEGSLVRVESLHFKNAKTTFAGDTTYWAYNNAETESLDIRIDYSATTIIGQTIPSETIAIIGNVTAFFVDTLPATQDTWQLMPRLWSDIVSLSQILDVGVMAVLEPSGTIYQGSSNPVKATVKNYGNVSAPSFDVIFTISEGKVGEYCDTFTVTGLTVGQELEVEFDDPYLATNLGLFSTSAKTELTGDAVSGNDNATGSGFEVITAPPVSWGRRADISGIVKDGGTLVAASGAKDEDVLYAFRGSKSKEFYMYNGTWTQKDTIPFGYKFPLAEPPKINKKYPGKGASLCYDGVNTIYASKGNGTWEFWAYDITANTWTAKAFIPSLQKIKGGTSMAYKNGLVYLLAGAQKKDNFDNFFAYDPTADTALGLPWTTLTGAPITPPATLKAKPFKDGSAISVIGNTIYAIKGGDKYNFFYAYDIATDIWTEMETIPLVHPKLNKKNKVGDGGAMTTDGSILYVIKGKGKQDFWAYTPGTKGVWTPMDTIPRVDKKSVPKTGAAIAFVNDSIYLLKGNKTIEFWCYGPVVAKAAVARTPYAETYSAVMSTTTTNEPKFNFNINPNPFTKLTSVRYIVPVSGKVSIKLYNAFGKLIETRVNEYKNAGSYSLIIDNWKLNIPSGVYFLKYESNTNKSELKLIVQ